MRPQAAYRRGVRGNVRAKPGTVPTADGVEEIAGHDASIFRQGGSCLLQSVQIPLLAESVRVLDAAGSLERIDGARARPFHAGPGELGGGGRPSLDPREQSAAPGDDLPLLPRDRTGQLDPPQLLVEPVRQGLQPAGAGARPTKRPGLPPLAGRPLVTRGPAQPSLRPK